MKSKIRFFGAFIVIFVLFFVIFLFFMYKKQPAKNNITSSQLREAATQFNIHILRYEQDLFSLDMNNLQSEIERLSRIYPPILIEPDVWNDEGIMTQLRAYLQDTVNIALFNAVEKVIKTNILTKELESAFGYYKVLYPDDSIPGIITMIPGLDLTMPSVYMYGGFLFVNIDMYVGADNPLYGHFGMPLYISERCEPLYIPVDIFKKVLVYKHLTNSQCSTLLEFMITEGKKLFFTEMMFPAMHERFIIGYSEEKYNWANTYLGNVWSYMIEKNELFGKGEALQRCYIDETPFTKIFGNDSPGRLGAFVGWKLIQSYMKNNPDVKLQELMQETDYQKILSNSKFKPQPK
jgi:uncharacterized protein YneF (UPF0154 family)